MTRFKNSALGTLLLGFGITSCVLLVILAAGLGALAVTGNNPFARAAQAPEPTALAAVTPSPTHTATATRAAAPAAVVTPTAGPTRAPASGFLNLPFTRGNPPTFDPAVADDTASSEIIMEVFSGLVTIDRDLKIQPDLAESWTIGDDQKTYTFKLRPDAQFQNGKPITAHDFKYSFERAADPKTGSPVAATHLGDIVGVREKLAGRAQEVSGVKVLDDHTLQLTLDAPKVYFTARLATTTAFVVDRENVEKGGANWYLSPNGSGPYRLVSFKPNEKIVLESNDRYTGSPKPTIRTVTYTIQKSGSMTADYLDGKLDSTQLNALEIAYAFDPRSTVRDQITVAPVYRLEYIGLNTQLPPFDDPQVRQAFALAIDKKTIADVYLQHTALAANGIYPPGFPGFDPSLKGWDFDPLKARELIRKSKYGDASKLPKITLDVAKESIVSQAVIMMLRQNLGVDVTVRENEVRKFLRDLTERPLPYQMYELGRVAEYPDAVFLEIPFYSTSTDNSTGYNNPEVDRLLDQARVERDEKKRAELYQSAERIVVDEAPWIPLLFGDNYWLTKPYVKDLIYPPFNLPRLKYAYLEGAPSDRTNPIASPANPPVQTSEAGNVIKIDLVTNDLVYNAADHTIYASVPSSGGERGNTLTALNARTGEIKWSVPVGSEPKKLARADDGKTLYIALDGAAAVRRFDLDSRQAGMQFDLGSDSFSGPFYVEDMQVMPGNPDVVAVALQYKDLSPKHAGVAIYDKGVARAQLTPGHTGSNSIAFGASPDTLYGYNNETTEYGFRRMVVNKDGVQIKDAKSNLITGFRQTILFDHGLIYSTGGRVVDPVNLRIVGSYPAEGLIQPDSRTKRTYMLTDGGSILRIFDQDTFVLRDAFTITGVLGKPGSLIRLDDGLAFRTDAGQVFILKLPTTTAFNQSDSAPRPPLF